MAKVASRKTQVPAAQQGKKSRLEQHPTTMREKIKIKPETASQKQKGPLISQRPFVTQFFRSYDNPNTICQNLPETAVTSAGAEEGQREKLETWNP